MTALIIGGVVGLFILYVVSVGIFYAFGYSNGFQDAVDHINHQTKMAYQRRYGKHGRQTGRQAPWDAQEPSSTGSGSTEGETRSYALTSPEIHHEPDWAFRGERITDVDINSAYPHEFMGSSGVMSEPQTHWVPITIHDPPEMLP